MARETSTSRAVPCALMERALQEEPLKLPEIEHLLSLEDPGEVEMLLGAADLMRQRYVGDDIHLRGIVEFSNHCRRSCCYCGLRAGNREVARYRIPEDEIVLLAARIEQAGCTTIVLQSGEDLYYDRQRLCTLLERIRKETSLAVTLSLGERSYDDYHAFRESGADRYLMRHETASASLYARHHPDSTLAGRLQCLQWLKSLGYEVGSGCIVGLPGQTIRDLAEDVLLLRDCDADMIGIGPFIPHENTPLAGHPFGDTLTVLKMIAVVRLVTKDTNIPATTALGVVDQQSRKLAFRAGANVFMPVFTPSKYAGNYEIYPGKGALSSLQEDMLQTYREVFAGMGRPIGRGYGFRQAGACPCDRPARTGEVLR